MKSYRAPASFRQGRYIPNKVLGTGTYGQVIRCYDTFTGEEVAVKVAQRDDAYRRSALNEIAALVSLKESYDSVSILDSFEDGGHVCIVSELLDCNLFEVLRHRGFSPLSLPEVRQVALRVLSALASLHSNGYIHCDIKPENIMLRRRTPVTADSSSVLGSNTNEGASCRLSKSRDQNSFPNALTSGQETLMVDIIANTHDQLWRSTNVIDSLAGRKHGISFLDSDMNAALSPRTGNCFGGYSQTQHRHSGGFDAIFGVPAAGVSTSRAGNDYRNALRADRETPTEGSNECQEWPTHRPDCNPYSRTCLIDFGAVRRFNENTYYDVQSLWYRAPEVLCGLPYTTAIDSWSVGCVLFELFTGKPLFPGEDLQQQLSLIVQHVGYPSKAALTMGCLASQFQLPMTYVLPNSRREHVQQCILASRKAGVERWRKHQMHRHQEAHAAGHPQSWSRCTTAFPSSTAEDDYLLNASPYGVSGVEAPSEGVDLLVGLICDLLHPDESQRMSCTQALRHPFFNRIPACGNTTSFPQNATSTACLPSISAAPAPMPCVMTTNTTGRPVVMTASPVTVSVGCSPVSPFVVHPVHSAPAAAVPFTVAAVGSMMGMEMKASPLSVPPSHQSTQAFSAYPAVATSTVYTTNATGQVLQCSVPVFTPMAHRVAPTLGPTFLPLGMTAQSPVGGAFRPFNETASHQRHQTLSDVNLSPTFSPTGTLVHSTVPLGFMPTEASDPSTAATVASDVSLQPRNASSYVFASAGAIPCTREYDPDILSAGVSPYVLCPLPPHHACAAVMSP
ncbi:hypothetical protein JKF63_00702 [Porcisia hertigi]|uniref:Protein kinase domain-containing protein n=1 Tax=Porcisia hertigi TaxID=2761500 RepID=A0A836KYK4_9TRYP|nr:hypothetical protein JKF63_00702 [Porcisia hertigi]